MIKKVTKKNQLIILKITLVSSLVYFAATSSFFYIDYDWQWYRVIDFIFTLDNGVLKFGPLIKGLGITLLITVFSIALAMTIGIVTAILRLSNSILAKFVSRVYLEIVRNTPLLVQLLFFYFVIAPLFEINSFWSSVISLGLFEGAYISEIIRSGVLSVPKSQWDSSYSLGLNKYRTYKLVILPQGIRKTLGMLAGQLITLIKDSSLVSTIAVYDLTMEGQRIISETFLTFEIWFTIAAIYLIINLVLSFGVSKIEKRMSYIGS